MASASLFEQLTSSVSLSMLAIVSVAILVLLLIYTVACRIFFSTSKSKTSTSKQHSNKDKKSKESNTIKKQQGDIASNNKKKTNKIKKNVLPVSSTSLPNTQSEESENEKTTLVESSKKSTSPIKTSASKKVAVIDENNKSNTSTNVIKTSSTKQQQPSIRTENVKESTGGQSEDNKNKQVKTNATPTSANTTVASNKQKPSGKRDGTTKVKATNSKKNETVTVNAESKRNLTVDGEAGSDQEDEGQWLTQSSKQVNHRNRNKGKTEPSNTNNQPLSNHNVVSEQRSMPTISNSNISSSINNNELNVETTPPLIDNSISSIENSEPIEICQLLPTTENLYTSNDNWWKQALNKQQTFSIDDIGEWPEHEQDEQYIVQIKRIIPIKKLNEKQNSDDV